MIGLSVSFCVKDIIQGKVALEDIEKIIGATKCETPEDWDKVIAIYREGYWRDDPERADLIIRQLLNEGKIEQPRVQGLPCHNIAKGHWIKEESQC